MDFLGESGFPGGNAAAVPDIPGAGFNTWPVPGYNDLQAVWATEDDYRAWNSGPSADTPSNSSHDGRQDPPNKKSRTGDSHAIVTNRSKAIGRMFYKTKLCCKFRAGVCPYITNCNFAHGMEELRKPPPNWQEIVAAHEGERADVFKAEPREEHQIPILTSPDLRPESQRSYKGRHCKKFYTEEGCPYGDSCTFLHDEQSRARESVAISVTPTIGGGFNNNNSNNSNLNGSNQKPSNWKTRICNKWETTGYCPFGSKCHFAHGIEELHKYGGGLVEVEGKEYVSDPVDANQMGASLKATNTVVASTLLAPHGDVYAGLGVPSQRPSGISQRHGQRAFQKWKGPDKISKIYGDWIDDIE